MEYNESAITRGYRKFFDVYRVDIDRIPKFDQFVLALREALTACDEAARKSLSGPVESSSPDVKASRLRLGLSLKALARKSGVSVLTLRGVERGTVKPQKGTLAKIQDALSTLEGK